MRVEKCGPAGSRCYPAQEGVRRRAWRPRACSGPGSPQGLGISGRLGAGVRTRRPRPGNRLGPGEDRCGPPTAPGVPRVLAAGRFRAGLTDPTAHAGGPCKRRKPRRASEKTNAGVRLLFFRKKALDNGARLCYNSRTSLSCASCGFLPHAVSFLLFRSLVSQAEGSGEPGYPAEALRCMAPALHPGRLNAAAPGGKKSS